MSLTAAFADNNQTDFASETEESDEKPYDIPEGDTDEAVEQMSGDEPVEEDAEDQGKEETPVEPEIVKYYSPLTGVETSEANTKKPVLAVMIENSPEARPVMKV